MQKRRYTITLALIMALTHDSVAKEFTTRLQWASGVLEQKEMNLVQYCNHKLPEQEVPLAEDYRVFSSRLKEAVREITDLRGISDRFLRRAQEQALMLPPNQAVVAQFRETLSQGMAIAEMRDPVAVCKELSIRLTHMTADSIKADIQNLLLTEFLNSADTGSSR